MNVKKLARNRYVQLALMIGIVVGFMVVGISMMFPDAWGHWNIWEWRYYPP